MGADTAVKQEVGTRSGSLLLPGLRVASRCSALSRGPATIKGTVLKQGRQRPAGRSAGSKG